MINFPGRVLLRILGKEFFRNEIQLRSAGVSYFIFFAMIPIVTTVVSLVLMVPMLEIEAEQVVELLTDKLLPEAVYDIKSVFISFSKNASVICVASFIASTWLLSKIVFFFEESLNRFWRLKAKRSPIRIFKKAFLLYFLAILGISVSTFLPEKGSANIVIELLITWSLFWGFNRIVPAWSEFPQNDVRWISLLPGSLLCGSVWYVSKWGFTEYLHRFASPDHLSAMLGVLPIFLLWLYFSSYMMLFSACLNHALYLKRAAIVDV